MEYKQLSERTWNKRIRTLAYQTLMIGECKKCGSPVNKGWCCSFCGDTDPSRSKEQA